ncbi:MAG: hypothetical protein KJ645_05845 [Planctomycetes bacterium]|nr:hypothetical protein [Planctomycetota bacterium]
MSIAGFFSNLLLLNLFLVTPASSLEGLEVSYTMNFQVLVSLNTIQSDKEDEGKEPLYPALAPLEIDKVKNLLDDFKNRNPEKRKAFEKKMITMGRGTIPLLLQKGATSHEAQGECIFNCLLALMDDRDVPTLLKYSKSKTIRLRSLSVIKIAKIQNPQHLGFLKEAIKDPEASIRLEAALGITALGDPAGIGEIATAVAANSPNPPARLFEPLPHLKGNVFTGHLYPFLVHNEDPMIRAATAQMIGVINDQKLNPILERGLHDSHNLVQAATVNALRKTMDNEEPKNFDNVFELVEEVDRWKKKLGASR